MVDIKDSVAVLNDDKRENAEIIFHSYKLIQLLNHLKANEKWEEQVDDSIKLIVNDLENKRMEFEGVRDLIIETLQQHNLGTIIDFEMVAAGVINLNIKLTTTEGNYYFRAYNENQDMKHIKLEHKLLEHLTKNGFKAIGPIKTKLGSTYYKSRNGRICSIFRWQKGRHFYFSFSGIKRIARTLGSYHTLVKDFHPNPELREQAVAIERQYRTKSLLAIEYGTFKGNNSVYAFLRKKKQRDEIDNLLLTKRDEFYKIFKFIQTQLLRIQFSRDDFVLLHSDLHGGNMLFRRKKLVAILDFDFAQYWPTQYELVTSLLLYCYDYPQGKFNIKLMGEFVKNYHTFYQKHIKGWWISVILLYYILYSLNAVLRSYYFHKSYNVQITQINELVNGYVKLIEWMYAHMSDMEYVSNK
tara:strand:- start:2405 stop:3640 length:1236 start_codon:yes stop_codon:yes gene_type:complete